MTDEDLEKKTKIVMRYTEAIELSKLYDEAEVVLKEKGFTMVHYPWYEMAKTLQTRGLCQITEELNAYGRIRWRLIKFSNIDWSQEPIDPSETVYQNPDFHKKIVKARRFLIDSYKKM
jgi:hypothetical protein